VPANIVEGASRRLEFLAEDDYSEFQQQVRATHIRLHGLIKAVEKEAGMLSRAAATVTSALALMLARILCA